MSAALRNIDLFHVLIVLILFVLFYYVVKIRGLYDLRHQISAYQHQAYMRLLECVLAPVILAMLLAAFVVFTPLVSGRRGYSVCMALVLMSLIPLWSFVMSVRGAVSNFSDDEAILSMGTWAIGLIIVFMEVFVFQAILLYSASYSMWSTVLLGGVMLMANTCISVCSYVLYHESRGRVYKEQSVVTV